MSYPNRELHRERMTAIGLAIKATKEAMALGVHTSMFYTALSSLRIARFITWIDYRNRLRLWREDNCPADEGSDE